MQGGSDLKRVVIALTMGSVCGQRKMSGILKYLSDSGLDWNIIFHRFHSEMTVEYVKSLPAREIDGVIYSCPMLQRQTRELTKQEIPLVAMDVFDRSVFAARMRNIAFIQSDGHAIGRTAADFLFGQGRYRSFAFIPDGNDYAWSAERLEGYAERLSRQGVKPHVYRRKGCGYDIYALGRFLAKLPRPVAVFAAHDDRAMHVLEACREKSLDVPGEVGVLGVDNDEMLCAHTTPTLTSIQADHFRMGYRAAELLDGLMSGKGVSRPQVEDVGVVKLVARESASPVSVGGHLVQRALVFIAENACRGIGVEDVVASQKCSHRLLNLRFRELAGTTIAQAIRTVRMEEVRRRLDEGRESRKTIATECGFRSARALNEFLRRG